MHLTQRNLCCVKDRHPSIAEHISTLLIKVICITLAVISKQIHCYVCLHNFIVLPVLLQQPMAAHHVIYEPLPREWHAPVTSLLSQPTHPTCSMANSVEVLDVTTELWEQKPTHGTPPRGLWDTAYTVVGSCLFVFGGYDGESCHNSLFKLDLRTFQWEEVKVSNPSSGPQRKTGSGMVSCGDDQLVVFAGYTSSSDWTNELHVFNLDKGGYSLHQTMSSQTIYCTVHVHGNSDIDI